MHNWIAYRYFLSNTARVTPVGWATHSKHRPQTDTPSTPFSRNLLRGSLNDVTREACTYVTGILAFYCSLCFRKLVLEPLCCEIYRNAFLVISVMWKRRRSWLKRIKSSNVTVQWVAHRVLEVPSSDLSLETNCLDWDHSFFCPTKKMMWWIVKLKNDDFLALPLQVIVDRLS
jgi:hypothetical protein